MKKLMHILLSAGFSVWLISATSNLMADGFYIGGGVYSAEAEAGDISEDDVVPAVFLGYQFLDTNLLMLSAELGYYDLGSYSGTGYSVETDALTLAGVVYFPFTSIFEVYGKAGIASVGVDVEVGDQNEDFDGEEAFVGIGAGFDILDTIDIYIEYLVFDNEVDSEMLGVGVRFDFF